MSSAAVTRAPAAPRFERVVDVVGAAPGLSYSEVARRLGGRRSDALALVKQAAAAGVVHEGSSLGPTPGGSRRLFLEPPVVEDRRDAQPALPFEALTLRELRAQARVSLAALADQLGVSRNLVHLWETERQPMPAWARRDLLSALEDAQTPDRPSRRRDARRRRELLDQIRRTPGVTRDRLAGRSSTDRQLLEQARRAGQVHEAPTWTSKTRQSVVGLFPGPRPRTSAPQIRIEDLRRARLAAGWSLETMATGPDRIGVAGTTLARWERECDVVPGWATTGAAAALVAARAAARDDQGAVLERIRTEPGLTRKQLLGRLGFTRSPATERHVDALLAAGLVHARHAGRRGVRDALYPGPAPAAVLTPDQLRDLRRRAGLEQRQLAEQVGTHVQAVRDWEGGRRPLSIDWQHTLRAHLEQLPDVDEQLRQAVVDALAAQPATFHQLDRLGLGSRSRTAAAVDELLAAGRVEHCRLANGRLGYRLPR